MTLREWVAQHRDDIVESSADAAIVSELRAVADREIGDAESVRSDEGRLEHAHAACLAVASAGLAARGYRVRRGAFAHHWLLVESLQHTLALTPGEVKELHDYRQKRSRSMYERTGIVTHTESEAALATARRLRDRLANWLGGEHSDTIA